MANSIFESTILIVDDTPENIDILNDVLKDFKRKVATSGERALKIANSANPPDIILLDIMMPEMDGFEVCKRLKSDEKTKNIPVIFITAMSEVEDETKGLELGAVDFITKPISPPIVLARVKNHLYLQLARQTLVEQNDLLEDRNEYITDSIKYAKRIQTAILPGKDAIQELFNESFLIYRPKDIVSGDFYWIKEVEDKILASVIDCTGHGVPGAFMSMIGNTLLNEIVTLKKVTDPSEVLELLNTGIVNELNKESNEDSFDGMDLSICLVDKAEKKIKIASAYRPIFYFMNDEFFEFKGTRKSIGDKKRDLKYEANEIAYEDSIVLYQFSDGLVDQNNSDNKKFGTKKFKTLLNDIYKEDFNIQKEKILTELADHQGVEVQRDDITVMGIKIN